jgi:hypothetical protein
MKKQTLSKVKKKAWTEFSLYIRTRDALKTTGDLERCLCVTCGREYPTRGIGSVQAGHFIPGRGNSILFDERNCHGQCYGCNVGKNGAAVEYFVFMENTYGREVINELRFLKGRTRKYSVGELEIMAQEYRDKTRDLEEFKLA